VVAELVRLGAVTSAHPADPRWQYSLPATFVFFVPGMLLAVLETQWESVAPRLRRGLLTPWAWFAAGVALWLVVTWRYDLDVLLVPAAFVMVGSVVLPMRRGVVHRVLEWRPLAAVGVASYSLYLWHFPIVTHVGTASWAPHDYTGLLVVCVPFSVAVALVSYRVVEAPFLRLRRAWASTSPAPAPELVAEPQPRLA
jgi:peptidoglycan/LPS O-acetylase OafA/YrhL